MNNPYFYESWSEIKSKFSISGVKSCQSNNNYTKS